MAAPLILVSSMATRNILADALADYSRQTGTAVDLRAMGGVDAAERVRQGEAADIVLLASGAMRKLADEGHVLAGSLAPFATSGMAIAVAQGAALPDLSSGEAVKRVMQSLRVGYSTGPSGDHLKSLWQKWGIAETMAQQAVQAPPGVPVARLVAEGQAELGVQQLSELLGQPGIAIAGPLPPDIQLNTVFTAAIAARSQQVDAARALLAHLASAETTPYKLRRGMAGA